MHMKVPCAPRLVDIHACTCAFINARAYSYMRMHIHTCNVYVHTCARQCVFSPQADAMVEGCTADNPLTTKHQQQLIKVKKFVSRASAGKMGGKTTKGVRNAGPNGDLEP